MLNGGLSKQCLIVHIAPVFVEAVLERLTVGALTTLAENIFHSVTDLWLNDYFQQLSVLLLSYSQSLSWDAWLSLVTDQQQMMRRSSAAAQLQVITTRTCLLVFIVSKLCVDHIVFA